MKATQAEKQLIKELQILKTNLVGLSAQQKIDLVQEGEFIMTAKQFQAMCQDRNKKAAINKKLNRELVSKAGQISRLEKELQQARQDGGAMRRCLKKDLAEMTDEQLKEYGLVSYDTYNEHMDEAEKALEEAEHKAKKVIQLFKQHNR